jgi:cardiolipin synthase
MNIPNAITIARTLLIPVILYLLWREEYGAAFLLFSAAAVGDFLDGYLARRLDQRSQLGALLDPAADKATMLGAVLLLAWQGALPMWLAAAIVLRDLIIVVGALTYRALFGFLEVAPTWASKLNTALEFLAVAAALAVAAELLEPGGWLAVLYRLVALTVAVSGAQYVWVWGRKAMQSAAVRRPG